MTLIDWVLVVVWAGIALSGFWKGAVRIVFGVGGAFTGLWLATATGGDIAARLEGPIGIGWLAVVLGWAIPLLLCIVLCVLAGWGVERTLEALHLKWLNRLLGAAIAAVAGVLLLLGVVVVGVKVSPALADLCAESYLISRLLELFGSI